MYIMLLQLVSHLLLDCANFSLVLRCRMLRLRLPISGEMGEHLQVSSQTKKWWRTNGRGKIF